MTHNEEIDKIVERNEGMIGTAQVVREGISKPLFYDYLRKNNFEKVAPGIYSSPDAWVDEMYIIHLRFGQAVFSHETALYLHDLTDREPLKYSLTVNNGYNPTQMTKEGIKVYTVKRELHDIGIISMNTPFGHRVPIYDMERTICDIVRSQRNIEIQVFSEALKNYAASKDKDLQKLMQYAAQFHVSRLLRQYMEVLL